MNKQQIEKFLIERRGYLKKSALEVAKALWKLGDFKVKNEKELKKELEVIKQIQTDLKRASVVQEDNLLNLYNQIAKKREAPKRLYFDIEVSGNIVMTWRIGRKINLNTHDIIKERAVICIAYQWEGEDKVNSLQWKNGEDKEMLIKFSKVIESADEVVTQNGDKFDIKWLRGRCLYHRIKFPVKLNSIDTLKMLRSSFLLNSNKLDYVGQILKIGAKTETNYEMWKQIMLYNNKKSLNQMVSYCKNDVKLLQDVFKEIQEYCPKRKFKYI